MYTLCIYTPVFVCIYHICEYKIWCYLSLSALFFKELESFNIQKLKMPCNGRIFMQKQVKFYVYLVWSDIWHSADPVKKFFCFLDCMTALCYLKNCEEEIVGMYYKVLIAFCFSFKHYFSMLLRKKETYELMEQLANMAMKQ